MPTEVYEICWNGNLAGQFVQTVQHVKATVTGTPNPFTTAQLIGTEINSGGINEAWTECLPTDYVITSLRVRRVSAGGGPTFIIPRASLVDDVGTRSGSISSAQVNPLIIWIPTTAPSKTGRVFLPGVSEDDIEDMVLAVTLLGKMVDFGNEWIAGGTITGPDTFVGCVFRRATLLGDTIFAGQVSPLIGTQRRRLHPV